jgi:5'-nucleotidase
MSQYMTHPIKRILITGDDGYTSPGTRLLAHFLKEHFDCMVVATKSQMSAVGGALHIKEGGTYGSDTVEGVPALWVDGYPCDALEYMVGRGYGPFDLVVSGINWGMNIGNAIVSSGTYSAAIRSIHIGLAPKAIAISWFTPPSAWTKLHNHDDSIEEFLTYPGKTAVDIIQLSIQNNFWGADLLNINLPESPANTIRFTKGLEDLKQFFNYPLPADETTHTFSYPKDHPKTNTINQLEIDTGALLSGYISISPHKKSNLDETLFQKLKDTPITLP